MRRRRFSVAPIGQESTVFGRWKKRREERRANKQEGDVHSLDREGDPRGGVQSDTYRHADPRDVVTEEGVTMAGPGGAPQDATSAEERRTAERE
jgi:hypothetical protein